jgi:glycosyltransferase involved in cell wall biosynthesis
MDAARRTLCILPCLPGRTLADGRIVLTKKLIDGAVEIGKHWPGPTRVVVEPWEQESDNLDNVAVTADGAGCQIRVASYDSPQFAAAIADAGAVLASVSHRQNHIADLCRARGIACAYVSEYTLRTRFDIVRAETKNPVLWTRRYLWEATQERRTRHALRRAAGVQCNGTPTYDAYHTLTPRALLFFDSRSRAHDLVDADVLGARLQALRAGRPLRLAFSGRFLIWKGVQFLPPLLAALRARRVAATLDLCGDGALLAQLRADVARLGLGDRVHLRGNLDFARELTPLMQREIDLFVCPHVQGDPSSTFSEVFAAGVPIAGFASEALAGMLRLAQAGWTTPVRDVGALATQIQRLDAAREELAGAALRARAFAAQHTFERTAERRAEHLLACAGAGSPASSAEPARGARG